MKIKNLFLLSIFFCYSNMIYALSPWQGEWGTWKKDSLKENSTNFNTGSNISIYDCNAAFCLFTFRVGGIERENGKIKMMHNCDWKGKLHVNSPQSAEGITMGLNNTINCKFNFSMDNPASIHISKREGSCDYYCSGGEVIRYPEYYSLRTHDTYKIKGYLSYNQVCYTDSSLARQVWCKDQQLQDMDQKLFNFTFQLQNHIKKYSSENISQWLTQVLQQCENNKDIHSCLLQAYAKKILSLEQIDNSRKKEDEIAYNKLMLPGDSAEASKIINNIQGVYKHKVHGRLYDGSGETYIAEDILEIVRVSKDVIYFKTSLSFDNGHSGSLFGIARYKKEGLFLYIDNLGNNGQCLFKIIPKTTEIQFATNGHCSYHYGARGSFEGIKFSYKERRPIRYMKLLLNSEDYKNSVKKS